MSSWGGLEASQRALGALLRTPGIDLRGPGSPLGPLWGRLGGSWGVSGLVFRGSEGPWGHFFEWFCRLGKPSKRKQRNS